VDPGGTQDERHPSDRRETPREKVKAIDVGYNREREGETERSKNNLYVANDCLNK
jgi:hypothetical protein